MKKIIISVFLLSLSLGVMTSCSKEDDFEIPTFKPLFFGENFPEGDIDYNADFDFPGWVNYAETGSKKWIERDFNNSGYIQFSPFGSGQASNIGWAITPKFSIGDGQGVVFSFTSATNFVDNPNNKLEVFISTNYNGTEAGVLTANWTQLNAVVANETTNGYVYIPSGEIDLSDYSGEINIAFKVTGNGTTLDGLFQVDDIKIYKK
ncbi:MAG: DUF5017 domain-containing protein [Flavobacterium sp.]|nr:DUF5017 domain-containing protein [Flavobacterium sp.]